MSNLENDVCVLCQKGFIVSDKCNTCGVNYIDCSDLNLDVIHNKIQELLDKEDEWDD